MTDLRDAAKLALEALWMANTKQWPENKIGVAINRLQAALAEDAMDRMAENARELGLDKDYARGYVAGMDSQMFADDTSQQRVDKAEEQRHEPIPWATDMKIDSTNALEVPRAKWVGLTDEDELDWEGGDLKSLISAVEAKLKEKNQ